MLNNIHFVALHVLMCTVSSFAVFIQDSVIKFDATLMLVIGSPVSTGSASLLPLTLPDLNI